MPQHPSCSWVTRTKRINKTLSHCLSRKYCLNMPWGGVGCVRCLHEHTHTHKSRIPHYSHVYVCAVRNQTGAVRRSRGKNTHRSSVRSPSGVRLVCPLRVVYAELGARDKRTHTHTGGTACGESRVASPELSSFFSVETWLQRWSDVFTLGRLTCSCVVLVFSFRNAVLVCRVSALCACFYCEC